MKRFFYSAYVKAIAFILLILFIVLGVLNVVQCVSDCYTNENYVYNFRDDYRDGISYFMDYICVAVVNAYHDTYRENIDNSSDKAASLYLKNDEEHVLWKEQSEKLKEILFATLEYNLDIDKNIENLDYFIKINDNVFTNCGARTEADINKDSEMYMITKRDSAGNVTVENNFPIGTYYYLDNIRRYGINDDITICATVKESVLNEYKKLWNEQESYIFKTFLTLMCFLSGALIMLIYLIVVCGKNKKGELTTSFFDRIWTEITLGIPALVVFLALVAAFIVIENYLGGNFPSKFLVPVSLSVTVVTAITVTVFLLSLVRKMKCGIFFKTSIIFILMSAILKIIVKASRYIYKKFLHIKSIAAKAAFRKTSIILALLLLLYTAVTGLMGVLIWESPIFFFIAVMLFIFAAFFVIHRGNDTDIIKQGVKEIRNGNISYKIPVPKSEDIKEIACDIQYIAEGLEKSVAERTKAERLKTDLITNVSHDLKTPLTSIINYTELLLGVPELPQEAKDYALIIAKKGDGLKKLTQDLFEVSKVQSGNEIFNPENLDVALLIEQTLGEFDDEIKASEITMCVKADKDLYIMADGKKMSRVMGNLIDNALKYAMKNTRVFIHAYREGSRVITEIKNISAYPMDFDEEEILGRFVRGDKSRTDGGNGLGLAIAQSFTEACGGEFKVVVDGDLFKAIITFEQQ